MIKDNTHWDESSIVDKYVEDLLPKLSIEDKVNLVSGKQEIDDTGNFPEAVDDLLIGLLETVTLLVTEFPLHKFKIGDRFGGYVAAGSDNDGIQTGAHDFYLPQPDPSGQQTVRSAERILRQEASPRTGLLSAGK